LRLGGCYGTVGFGKGAEAQGPRSKDRDFRTEIKISLTAPTLPQVHHSNIEEEHHGQQEEESTEEEVEVIAPASYWGRTIFGFARSCDLARRLDQGPAAFVFGAAFAFAIQA
jgi:hypothetical protein